MNSCLHPIRTVDYIRSKIAAAGVPERAKCSVWSIEEENDRCCGTQLCSTSFRTAEPEQEYGLGVHTTIYSDIATRRHRHVA